jgi:6-phosphogluconolactonase
MDDLRPQPEPSDDGATYDVHLPSLPQPALRGEVVVRADEDELIDVLSADLVLHAENCVRQFGDFHVALSGGANFERLYRRLMYDPNCRWLPWRRTHLWFVEERCTAFDDERSNYRFVSEIIGDHADIPHEQVHPIFVGSETADVDYERKLRETLAWREKGQDRLDYVLLGLGSGGRTAGLLEMPAADDADRLVRRSVHGESAPGDPPLDRVTMTPSLLNASRFLAVLATGEAAADAVRRLSTRHPSAETMPISAIDPINGELRWYLDAPACRDCT